MGEKEVKKDVETIQEAIAKNDGSGKGDCSDAEVAKDYWLWSSVPVEKMGKTEYPKFALLDARLKMHKVLGDVSREGKLSKFGELSKEIYKGVHLLKNLKAYVKFELELPVEAKRLTKLVNSEIAERVYVAL